MATITITKAPLPPPTNSEVKESPQPEPLPAPPTNRGVMVDELPPRPAAQEEEGFAPRPEDYTELDGPLPSNKKKGVWETIDFESPLELMYFFNPHLQEGIMPYHQWQIEVCEELGTVKPTAVDPYLFALCAANGSGKDSYVVAPFVIWFALTKIRGLVLVTSSSGTQLTAQTENLIATLARTVNAYFSEPVFKITKRFIRCLKSGSEIRLFATDEEGKAEGFHPFPDYPNAEMAIVVNEAKSVDPKIFRALGRCTGYNYMLNVSTPAEPIGDFWFNYNNWPHKRRVTAFDCPHIPRITIENLGKQHGVHSSIYRSQVLAEFTAVGGKTVIDQDHLNLCIEKSNRRLIKAKRFGKLKVGLDLAAGRDENVGLVVYGNVIERSIFFQEKDTVVTENRLHEWLGKLYKDFGKENVEIYADDGGVGHGILDHLEALGHSITRVLNNHKAFDSRQFGNRGTEMWYNMRRMVEECLLYLPLNISSGENEDMILYKQLAYRHFKRNEVSGRLVLMSKEDEKAEHKVGSPDRGDALALALSSTDHSIISREIANSDRHVIVGKTFDQILTADYEKYRAMLAQADSGRRGPIKGNSLEELLSRAE